MAGKERSENPTVVGEVTKTLVSIAKDSPETKEAAKNVAVTLKTVTGTLKRAVFPLAVLNYAYDKAEVYFKEKFQADITAITADIPIEKIVDPKPSLAGPALQGIAYSIDEEQLRDMYLHLLASAMNSDTAEAAHPSYVETIKQLTSAEASLLKIFLRNPKSPIAELRILTNAERNYETASSHIVNTSSTLTKQPVAIEMMPAYIENWVRLGLMTIDYGSHLADPKAYDWVTKRPEYTSITLPEVDTGEFQPTIDIAKGLMIRTKYGEIFGGIVGITNS